MPAAAHASANSATGAVHQRLARAALICSHGSGTTVSSRLPRRSAQNGVSAVCAEPYPFFWLDGGPGVVHRYGTVR